MAYRNQLIKNGALVCDYPHVRQEELALLEKVEQNLKHVISVARVRG